MPSRYSSVCAGNAPLLPGRMELQTGKRSPDSSDRDLPVTRCPRHWGHKDCPSMCSEGRRQTRAARAGSGPGCGLASRCSALPAPALSCPSSLAPSHTWRKTLRNVRGAKGARRRCRGQQRSLLPGGKTAEKAFKLRLRSCCQPICCHSSRGPWESRYMASGIVPGQDGICCGSGICLFSSCLLPEQGSHPGRL